MRRRGTVGTVMGVMACTLLATGCTMCPDPFDYSGPVPNGSAPQNDFMARSNGILPLRSRPLPWPPVVDADTSSGTNATADAGEPASVERVAAGAVAEEQSTATR